MDPIKSQLNPIHIVTTYFWEIYFNNILSLLPKAHFLPLETDNENYIWGCTCFPSKAWMSYENKTFGWISWTLTNDVDHERSEHDHPPPTAVWRRRLKTGVQFILVGGATGALRGGRGMRHLTVHHKDVSMWLTNTTNLSPRQPQRDWRQRWLEPAVHNAAIALCKTRVSGLETSFRVSVKTYFCWGGKGVKTKSYRPYFIWSSN